MYRSVRVGSKYWLMEPYKTSTELDILEFLTFNSYDEDNQYEAIVDDILQSHVSQYNRNIPKIDKIILLWNLRVITIGDEISLTYSCSKCGTKQTETVSIHNLILNSSESSDYLPAEFTKFKSILEYENIPENIPDNIPLTDYENIYNNILNYVNLYNNNYKVNCRYCNVGNFLNVFTYKTTLSFMSDDNFNSLTSWIHTLVFTGKNTREDVLKMSPIQRLMEIKYFKEHFKDNKQWQQNSTL